MATPLIIDTKLLVLLVVGSANAAYIGRHRRVREFDVIDYRWLSEYAGASDGLLFVPNVVTETSNLLRQIGDPMKTELTLFFGAMLRRAEERYVRSAEAVDRAEFGRLGVTDAVLLALASTGAELLTVDLHLYLAAQTAGLKATNYNHIRELRPDFSA